MKRSVDDVTDLGGEDEEMEFLEEDEMEEIVASDQDPEMEETVASDQDPEVENQVFFPGSEIPEGFSLEYDSKSYEMMHSLNVDWPCLSFDVVPDALGENRTKFPHSATIITGTQAEPGADNKVYLMTASHLTRTKYDDSYDSASDSDPEDSADSGDAHLDIQQFAHPGAVNRIRLGKYVEKSLVATQSESGKAYIWDFNLFDRSRKKSLHSKPSFLHAIDGGNSEGWAIDWNRKTGTLASGFCSGKLVVTESTSDSFRDRTVSLHGHSGSIEDLQWSPSENTVIASCSTDGTVGIWDLRSAAQNKPSISISAHPGTDVNVISWNTTIQYLLLSGADDGNFSSWDLRNLKDTRPLSSFHWHKHPITSLQWNPNESSVVAACDAHDQITLWDLSLEADSAEIQQGTDDGLQQLPPQLIFIHQGLAQPKELHWHPQVPGMLIGTGENGFNFFKTINV